MGGQTFTSHNSGTTSAVVTCLTPPSMGRVRILACVCYASGATATALSATNNAASRTIFSAGGVGTGLLDRPCTFGPGALGDLGDATKVTLTATGASASECTVIYDFVTA